MRYGYMWRDYIVASVDVLGQKDEFKKIENYLVDEVLQEKLEEVAENTIYVIEILRKGFKDLYEVYTAKSESKVKVPEEHKAEYDAMRESSPIRFQFFSDSMLAYVPLRTKKYRLNDMIAVYGVFTAVGGQLLMTLAMEDSYRAGIELGIGTEFEDGGIYGPALAEAHKLEDKVAKYPRIVIGNTLKNYLDNYSKGRPLGPDQNKRDVEGCKNMANICLRMIDKDLDGCLILDYLGEEFRNRLKINLNGDIYDMAQRYVEKKYKEKSNSGDKKLALRYEQLCNYFERRLSKF